MPPDIRLYIVRHGKTEYNVKDIIQGQLDIPLNSLGRSQAEESSEKFRNIIIDELWSSDLSRAKETAKIISQYHVGLPLQVDARLKERGMGSWQGKPNEEVGMSSEPDDVESYQATTHRTIAWLHDLLSAHISATESVRSVVVVTHEDCITSLAQCIRSGSSDIDQSLLFDVKEGIGMEDGCPNLGVSKIEFSYDDLKWKGTVFAWSEVGPV
ncbi:uncharacterized protein IL334_000397 [Kwoniella shivajii]|uniref:Phosphoglycerate mutase n=1 Tax=Kwoniella shivajii TaxID=564305 RepID=A0ABZ1CT91_9TREE|nr:hypothetical protein IL334_000397 [Kwoniella shivajii]